MLLHSYERDVDDSKALETKAPSRSDEAETESSGAAFVCAKPSSVVARGVAVFEKSCEGTGEVEPPAVVLGGGVSGLAVIRALGRRGVPSLVICPLESGAARSRWARPLGEIPVDASALHRALDDAGVRGAVLFPASDEWATAISRSERSERPSVVPSEHAIQTLTDKAQFAALAAQLDIPHPRSIAIDGVADLRRLSMAELRRYFLKPVDSQRFATTFGRKGIWAADPSASVVLERAIEMKLKLLLQEYVASDAGAHIFLDGYVARDGRVLAVYARRRLRMFPPDFGNSTLSEIIPLDHAATARKSLQRIFDGISFSGGLFDAEFVRDPHSGSFQLLEVNARAWWQLALAAHAGADVCWLAYLDALDEKVGFADVEPRGQRWVHAVYDASAWLTEIRTTSRSPGGAPPFAWRGAVDAVFARDDLGPARAFLEGRRIYDIPAALIARRRRTAESRSFLPPLSDSLELVAGEMRESE